MFFPWFHLNHALSATNYNVRDKLKWMEIRRIQWQQDREAKKLSTYNLLMKHKKTAQFPLYQH